MKTQTGSCVVTGKRFQGRYKTLMGGLEKKDRSKRRMSGIGGEVGELEELLNGMLEEITDILHSQNNEKMAKS